MRLSRLRQGLHEELAPKGTQEEAHRGEAVRVPVGGVQREVCPGRSDEEALQEAHWRATLQVPALQQDLLPERDP